MANESEIIGNVSIYVVSAICGNMWQESGINPGVWQNLRIGTFDELNHGYGLGQWTNTGGDTHGRLYRLHSWLQSNNYSDDDGIGQLRYLLYENVWFSVEEASIFSNLTAFLTTNITDIELLTHAFNIGWEGVHESSWDLRVQYAQNCYNYIIQNANNPNITTWYKGNTYLTEQERYNNAVLIYRFLSGGLPPSKKKKMPLWMKIRYHY